MTKTIWSCVALTAAFVAGFAARGAVPGESVAYAQAGRVLELRTYTAGEGKLDLLHARFRNHTLKMFQKHGMTNVWYGKTLDAPLSQNTMIDMLAHQSREAAKKSWDAFRADAEWAAIAKESGVGPVKVEAVFLEPTDYSPLK
jgi:hypothetical protein